SVRFDFAGVGAGGEPFGEGGGNAGQAHCRSRFLKRRDSAATKRHGPFVLEILAGARRLVADAHDAERTFAAWIYLHDVKSIARFGSGNFCSVHGVVAELLFLKLMLRVADLAIARDAFGIELDLDLYVGRRDLKRPDELSGEFRSRRFRRIDEAVTAITVARQLFEQVVVVTF